MVGKGKLRCHTKTIAPIAQENEWQRQSMKMENETDACIWMKQRQMAFDILMRWQMIMEHRKQCEQPNKLGLLKCGSEGKDQTK